MVEFKKSSISAEFFGCANDSMMPLTMKEATVSPGWMRDEIRMTYLLVSSTSGLVKVTMGMASPTKL
jgi:hypothetical protein